MVGRQGVLPLKTIKFLFREELKDKDNRKINKVRIWSSSKIGWNGLRHKSKANGNVPQKTIIIKKDIVKQRIGLF